MAKGSKKIDLGLKDALDEMFMDDAGRAENRLPKIYDIPLIEIDDFPNHPFKVKQDEDMDQLVESVKERGIITPITLRQKEDGRYEIVSGHRRRKACELAGLETVRAEIKELSHEEAVILMVESNLQRSTILPSEKAFAYKMKMDAMKHQGTSSQVATKSDTATDIGKELGESRDQVYRYIRLTNLLPELLDMVDGGKIALSPAVELSFLSEDKQAVLLDAISANDCTPSHAQAIRLKKQFQEGTLDDKSIYDILAEVKPNQQENFKFKRADIRKYFPESYTDAQICEMLFAILEKYRQKELSKQKDRDAR